MSILRLIQPDGLNPGTKTAVVCDTTAYIPTELIDELGIAGVVSLYVSVGEEQERESEIKDYEDFYARLRSSETGAKTSQPSVGDFTAVWEPLLAEGHDIVSIHLSAGISGTVAAANQARERLADEGKGGERIHVVDSHSACGGAAFAILAAARAANEGASAEEVTERATAIRSNLKMWFAVDTLEYLRRGGRIGGAAAWIGSALKIKPILTFDDEVTPIERVRTRSRAVERLRSYARQRHESGADAWIVQHIQDHEAAAQLVEDCKEIFGNDPVLVSEIGAVIGAHAGPGLLGVGSVPVEALG